MRSRAHISKVRIRSFEFHERLMRTRMPFKYGIATLTDLPHLMVRFEAEVDGRAVEGWAADGLPPKWFTKDPSRAVEDEIVEMREIIRSACNDAIEIGDIGSAFDLWKTLYFAKVARSGRVAPAASRSDPPALLANFGVTFAERAIIEAIARATHQTFHQLVRTNTLGIRLNEIHPELKESVPRDHLPPDPRDSIIARHTVGLSDPLTDAEIPPNERIDDGLPQSLEAVIATYGITHLKIKLAGDIKRDVERLQSTARLMTGRDYAFTLDGNENYRDVEPFRELWSRLSSDASLAPFLARLIFVEQPMHRDVALSDRVRDAFGRWSGRPRMIIDESDATTASLPAALDVGYVGVSHKNCKGIFKGIANACLISHRAKTTDRPLLQSGEDLTNVGPIALLQDLAVLSTLGITHAERNGHHYIRGLSAFDEPLQRKVVAAHPDLYRWHERGFATAIIGKGRMSTRTVNAAPLGVGLDMSSAFPNPLPRYSGGGPGRGLP